MSRLRSLALLSAVVALAGCCSYRPGPLAGIRPKNQIRATTRDGHRLELSAVTVAADTLRGLAVRQRFLQFGRDEVALAVADLTKVEVRRLNVGRSVAAGVAVAAMIAGSVAFVVALSNWDLDPLGGMHW